MFYLITYSLLILSISNLDNSKKISLSREKPESTLTGTLDQKSEINIFQLEILDQSALNGQKLFLIIETESNDIQIAILNKEESVGQKKKVIYYLDSPTGNSIFIMSDTYFKGKLNYFKQSGILQFQIKNQTEGDKLANYVIKAQLSNTLKLPFNKIYISRVDESITEIQLDLSYNYVQDMDLERLRFQFSAVKSKDDFSISANIKNESQNLQLNPIFQRTIGGMLKQPEHELCKEATCVYSLNIKVKGVKQMSFESYLIGKLEKIMISYSNQFYDRVYTSGSLTNYELVYNPLMNQADISITLIPVTSDTGLYINPITQPINLESYAWKEKGHLSKKITVRWEELVKMRAERQSLYITTSIPLPSEYLLKIEIHDIGYNGHLTPGVVETGFINFSEVSNYMYFYQITSDQNIKFEVDLRIITGAASIYLKQCTQAETCQLAQADLKNPDIQKIENSNGLKKLEHDFPCKNPTKGLIRTCRFVIAVLGTENNGTHFDISLKQGLFHRLLIPGSTLTLTIYPEEVEYLKFSSSGQKGLSLTFENLFGDFEIFFSNSEQYPKQGNNLFSEKFVCSKNGLYNSMRTIDLSEKNLGEGPIYFSIKAKTTASINIRFHSSSDREFSIHSIAANQSVRGQVSDHLPQYYTIRTALDTVRSNTATVQLTPLKGKYLLFANRNGKLPKSDNYELFSQNHQLELNYKDHDAQEEFIIGVQLVTEVEESTNFSYQYYITVNFADKPQRLTPGLVSPYILKEANVYSIQLHPEINNIMIVKSIIDGFDSKLCIKFSDLNLPPIDLISCEHSSEGTSVGIYLDQKQIDQGCLGIDRKNCGVYVILQGVTQQKIYMGYTFNHHPFKLIRDCIFQGPIVGKQGRIDFVYHLDSNDTVNLYFNSHGLPLKIATKIISGDGVTDDKISFPEMDQTDEKNKRVEGFVTNIFIPQQNLQGLISPELLISITGEGDKEFDSNRNFIIQVHTDSMEITRTKVVSLFMTEGIWQYFHFYNSGIQNSLRINVASNSLTKLEVQLSKGLLSRPPFTNKARITQDGISSVELKVSQSDLQVDSHDKEEIRGHYVIAVHSSKSADVSIYWNNIENQSYIELNPSESITMALVYKREFFFSFWVNESTGDKGNICLYIKVTTKAEILLSTQKDQTQISLPESASAIWKRTIGGIGGIATIVISPSDSNYCTNCLLVGSIEHGDYGQVTILANIEHNGIPIILVPGFTFPDQIDQKKSKKYKIKNNDTEDISFALSLLSGNIRVFVASSIEVSSSKYNQIIQSKISLNHHYFLTISPKSYNITVPHDYFILIENNENDVASFTLNTYKDNTKSPIEPGITRYLHILPKIEEIVYYIPKRKEQNFTVRLEVKQVFEENFIQEALIRISEFLEVFHISDKGDRYPIQSKIQLSNHNRFFSEYDLKDNIQGTYCIAVKNWLNTTMYVSLDLLSGNYKLAMLNERSIDFITYDFPMVYEANNQPGKKLHAELNSCYNEPTLSVYEENYPDNPEIPNAANTLSESFTSTSLSSNATRVFFRVSVPTGSSVYSLELYQERDQSSNYTSFSEGEDGRVRFIPETSQAQFKPIQMKTTYNSDFYHLLNYTLFLSDSPVVLKYAKTCGNYMIEKIYSDIHLFAFSYQKYYKNISEIYNDDLITLNITGLFSNKKYYGSVVATIDVMPMDEGYISPVRSGRAYYDDFIIMTPHFTLPFNMIVSILVLVGFLFIIFLILKAYIFGKLGGMQGLDKLSDLAKYDEGVLGFNIISILEKEYYGDQQTNEPTEKNEQSVEIEMRGHDNTTPLDK